MATLGDSQTSRNLLAAFARESQANRKYLWFAQRADIDGHPEIAALFRSIAEVETGHAFGLLEFLADVANPLSSTPIGETEANLNAAIASETEDHAELYPAFAAIARSEGFDEIATWFDAVARAEEQQAQRLREARALLDRGGR